MKRFVVWSTHVPEEGEPFDVAEVSRSDEKTAREDVGIIQSILHRKAWIQIREES